MPDAVSQWSGWDRLLKSRDAQEAERRLVATMFLPQGDDATPTEPVVPSAPTTDDPATDNVGPVDEQEGTAKPSPDQLDDSDAREDNDRADDLDDWSELPEVWDDTYGPEWYDGADGHVAPDKDEAATAENEEPPTESATTAASTDVEPSGSSTIVEDEQIAVGGDSVLAQRAHGASRAVPLPDSSLRPGWLGCGVFARFSVSQITPSQALWVLMHGAVEIGPSEWWLPLVSSVSSEPDDGDEAKAVAAVREVHTLGLNGIVRTARRIVVTVEGGDGSVCFAESFPTDTDIETIAARLSYVLDREVSVVER